MQLAMEDGVIVLGREDSGWKSKTEPQLAGEDVWGIAVDPADGTTVYAATMKGLFTSPDAGLSWKRIGQDVPTQIFWSVTVSSAERNGQGKGIVYAGT
jgi:hypothetical protein